MTYIIITTDVYENNLFLYYIKIEKNYFTIVVTTVCVILNVKDRTTI